MDSWRTRKVGAIRDDGDIIPIGIKDRGCVSSKQWNEIRQSPSLIDRYDSKRSSSARFPIDRNIIRVRLDTSAHAHSYRLLKCLTLTKFVSHAFFEILRLS